VESSDQILLTVVDASVVVEVVASVVVVVVVVVVGSSVVVVEVKSSVKVDESGAGTSRNSLSARLKKPHDRLVVWSVSVPPLPAVDRHSLETLGVPTTAQFSPFA
jgi:hypothetical protein